LIKLLGIKKGDWKAIAFCVFAAITFWFFNVMSIDYSIDVTHPLVIRYDEEQYVPATELPKQIRFSTTASGWDIFTKTNFVNSSPIEVELEDFKKRRYITASRLKSIVAKQMNGILINEILDDTIYVNFDKVKSKRITLQVDPKKIELAQGYRLAGTVSIEPSTVVATGPSAFINDVPDVVNIKINEKDISGKYEEEIPLKTSVNKKIKWSVENVKVKFESYQLEKVEKELKLTKINFPKKKKIKVSEEDVVKLIYYAREEDLALIETQKMEAVIDFYSINDKDKTIKITLKKVPELIQSYQFEPSSVKISYGE
jgi:hypothetical protein